MAKTPEEVRAKTALLMKQQMERNPALQEKLGRRTTPSISETFVQEYYPDFTAPKPLTVGTGVLAGAGTVGAGGTQMADPALSSGLGADEYGYFDYQRAMSNPAMGIVPSLGIGGGGGILNTIAGIAGIAGTGYAIAQALGLGEGQGLFGADVLGDIGTLGGGGGTGVSSIPVGGPGLAEPSSSWIVNEWHVNYTATLYKPAFKLQYYLLQKPGTKQRWIYMYNSYTGKAKYWRFRTPSLAVIGKNMPSHKMIVRLRKNLSKQRADAKTILKLISPTSLKQPRRRRR